VIGWGTAFFFRDLGKRYERCVSDLRAARVESCAYFRSLSLSARIHENLDLCVRIRYQHYVKGLKPPVLIFLRHLRSCWKPRNLGLLVEHVLHQRSDSGSLVCASFFSPPLSPFAIPTMLTIRTQSSSQSGAFLMLHRCVLTKPTSIALPLRARSTRCLRRYHNEDMTLFNSQI